MNLPDFVLDHVMIIDDNYIDRYVAETMIKKNQFAREINAFDMAGKALEYIQSHVDEPDALPQVILLDISMPLMDGFEFLEKLSTLKKFEDTSCKVYMLTSSLSSSDQARAKAFPIVKKFINKPLSAQHLGAIKSQYHQPNGATAA